MAKNRLSQIYRFAFILIAIWGFYLNSGIPKGQFKPKMSAYYTILSNLMCLLYYLLLVFVNEQSSLYKKILKYQGMVVIGNTITFLIYHFVLRSSGFGMGGPTVVGDLADTLVHYVVSIMVIIDWFVFSRKGFFKYSDAAF